MLTQEEFMDILAMKRQGLSISEIASETGYHPATISRWLRAGGPPAARAGTTPVAIDERWSTRIDELLRTAPLLLATSVFEILSAEGYAGSYPSVVRELRARRGPRFQGRPAVSVRIETPPGEDEGSPVGGPGVMRVGVGVWWSRLGRTRPGSGRRGRCGVGTYRYWMEHAGLRVTDIQRMPDGDSAHALIWARRQPRPQPSRPA